MSEENIIGFTGESVEISQDQDPYTTEMSIIDNEDYTMINEFVNAIGHSTELTYMENLFARLLADIVDPVSKSCRIKRIDLVKLSNSNRGSVSDHMKSLEEKGWIKVDRVIKSRRPHKYTILPQGEVK